MSLKIEIENLRDSLFAKASGKEKLFYCYVAQEPCNDVIAMPVGDLDRICFSVYNDSNSDLSETVQRIALSEPYKNIHYSNSITTLVAICLKSEEARSKYLKKYFDSHSLVEKFLLTKIFPTENFQFVLNTQTELDKLIDETFFHIDFDSAETHLAAAFAEVSDILELLAFRFAYYELLKIHLNTKTEKQLAELSNEVNKLISVVTKRISFTVDLLIFFILLFASPIAVYVLNKYYSKLQVDKLSAIWTFVSPIFASLVLIGRKLFPKVFSFYDDFKHTLVVFWFRLQKVKYSKLLELSKPNKSVGSRSG